MQNIYFFGESAEQLGLVPGYKVTKLSKPWPQQLYGVAAGPGQVAGDRWQMAGDRWQMAGGR